MTDTIRAMIAAPSCGKRRLAGECGCAAGDMATPCARTSPRTDDPAEAAACRRLWVEVALVAIADAERDPQGPGGAYLRSPDFALVADLSGLDGEAAQARVARLVFARASAPRPEAQRRAQATAARLTTGDG